jgi:hypothetical protein
MTDPENAPRSLCSDHTAKNPSGKDTGNEKRRRRQHRLHHP